MDIEALVKSECTYADGPAGAASTQHDLAYAAALREAFAKYGGLSKAELLGELTAARERYAFHGRTHRAMADCMVLRALLSEEA